MRSTVSRLMRLQ